MEAATRADSQKDERKDHKDGANGYCQQCTSKAYQTAWRRWVHWCDRRKVDPCSTSIENIANFLTGIFGEGKSHSTLNTYRSAISMSHDKVDGTSVGQHSALCRLLQGMYNARPPRPKHTTIWNVDQVIGHIRPRPPSKDLDLKELSYKLVTLLALANADRASDIHLLDLQSYREDRVIPDSGPEQNKALWPAPPSPQHTHTPIHLQLNGDGNI